MTTSLIAAKLTVPGTTQSSTFGDYLGEVVNARTMFGAQGLGDPDHDDTPALQAALDYCFGPYHAPHGGLTPHGPRLNKPLYIPPGFYYVNSPVASKAITGMGNDGSGKIRVTVASTAGLANEDTVYIRGATGTNFANYSYIIQDVTATTFVLSNSAWSGGHTWLGGGTVNVPALKTRAAGGLIFGSGRSSTFIVSRTQNAVCFGTNGFYKSKVDGISFNAALGGISFDLNSAGQDNIGCQSNYISNCGFGTEYLTCDYGLTIGMCQFMCSENTIFNCFVGSCDEAGIYIGNYNALSNAMYGGNIANCKRGIWNYTGSIPVIHGVAFQSQYRGDQIADIVISNATGAEGFTIIGCRTESYNFVQVGNEFSITIMGCGQGVQPTAGDGFFFDGSGYVTISNCTSTHGYITRDPNLILQNCNFSFANYLTHGSDNYRFLEVTPMRVTTQTGTTYLMQGADGGSKILFNNASPITVTLSGSGGFQLRPGSRIEVQQTGAGQVTFVGASGLTIRSRGGRLKLNGQYASAVLTCDVQNTTWTLEGDITA